MKKKFLTLCQSIHAAFTAPKREHAQYALFVFGVTLVALSLPSFAFADYYQEPDYNKLDNVIRIVLDLIEGRFGVLIMLCAGIGAIISSAFGQYRAALSLLVVALGAFILRTIISIFFNTQTICAFEGGC